MFSARPGMQRILIANFNNISARIMTHSTEKIRRFQETLPCAMEGPWICPISESEPSGRWLVPTLQQCIGIVGAQNRILWRDEHMTSDTSVAVTLPPPSLLLRRCRRNNWTCVLQMRGSSKKRLDTQGCHAGILLCPAIRNSTILAMNWNIAQFCNGTVRLETLMAGL
jgi:hypothetical protein